MTSSYLTPYGSCDLQFKKLGFLTLLVGRGCTGDLDQRAWERKTCWSVKWWHGWGKDTPILSPVAGGRAGLGGTRVGELALHLTNCSTGRAGPTPLLGKTVEVAMVVWVQLSWHKDMGAGELASFHAPCCSGWANQGNALLFFLFLYVFGFGFCLSVFLFNFVLFWGRLQGQQADKKGQGDEWDWSAWYESYRESILKSLKI